MPNRFLASLEYPRSYIAWDLETTGLDPKTDKILEIGALKVLDGHVSEVLHIMVNHGIDIPAEAQAIHGISREECEKDGISPAEAAKAFTAFFQWDTAIALDVAPNLTHNGFRFDIPFMLQFLREQGKDEYAAPIAHGCIDTAVFFKAKQLQMERWWHESFRDFADRVMSIRAYGVHYNLKMSCEKMGVDTANFKAHRALADVEMTHKLYQAIMKQYETQGPNDYPSST